MNDLILNLSITNPGVHAKQINPKLLNIPHIPMLDSADQPT